MAVLPLAGQIVPPDLRQVSTGHIQVHHMASKPGRQAPAGGPQRRHRQRQHPLQRRMGVCVMSCRCTSAGQKGRREGAQGPAGPPIQPPPICTAPAAPLGPPAYRPPPLRTAPPAGLGSCQATPLLQARPAGGSSSEQLGEAESAMHDFACGKKAVATEARAGHMGDMLTVSSSTLLYPGSHPALGRTDAPCRPPRALHPPCLSR